MALTRQHSMVSCFRKVDAEKRSRVFASRLLDKGWFFFADGRHTKVTFPFHVGANAGFGLELKMKDVFSAKLKVASVQLYVNLDYANDGIFADPGVALESFLTSKPITGGGWADFGVYFHANFELSLSLKMFSKKALDFEAASFECYWLAGNLRGFNFSTGCALPGVTSIAQIFGKSYTSVFQRELSGGMREELPSAAQKLLPAVASFTLESFVCEQMEKIFGIQRLRNPFCPEFEAKGAAVYFSYSQGVVGMYLAMGKATVSLSTRTFTNTKTRRVASQTNSSRNLKDEDIEASTTTVCVGDNCLEDLCDSDTDCEAKYGNGFHCALSDADPQCIRVKVACKKDSKWQLPGWSYKESSYLTTSWSFETCEDDRRKTLLAAFARKWCQPKGDVYCLDSEGSPPGTIVDIQDMEEVTQPRASRTPSPTEEGGDETGGVDSAVGVSDEDDDGTLGAGSRAGMYFMVAVVGMVFFG